MNSMQRLLTNQIFMEKRNLSSLKQNDLLVIDKPRKGMKPEEHELWEFLGLRPQPFENVRYLLPEDGHWELFFRQPSSS